MPAAERQLVAAVRRVVPEVKEVAIISPAGQCCADKSLTSEFGPSVSVAVAHDIASLSALHGKDAVIVNGLLVKENIVENPSALDAVLTDALKALKFGGAIIIREDLSKFADAKKVAKLTDYFDVFRTEIDGKNTGFDFYAVDGVEDSIYAHQNWQDVFWTMTKKEFPTVAGQNVTFRDFLDKTQYTDTGIYAYEWIFGQDFISPGGWDQNLAIIKRFGDMQAGETMLDIGVGIGGGARQVASQFGVHVTGIDLSSNMLAVALDRVHRDKDTRVKYMITDALKYSFADDSFDYVFSRDCIQHIEDTQKLFDGIYKCLKPGGKVLITMYGVGKGQLSDKFQEYVKQRQYYLRNLDQIADAATKAGFTDVYTENLTPRFKEILGEERSRVEDNKEEFLAKFSQKEYDSLVVGWNNKLQYIADDNHNWNLFMATKPAH